ncbi:sulfatase-like hydrolase/transferase [Haloarcula marina]|uniref:sulfatase-like hydrolase/transferase n=1 Tax=Haloarcula marina TaxID=2961574 RepID=UPI0020B8BBC7|nr:sulfatase-like hydrolase/transferase [Halomicroarcula marina]
MSPNIAVVVLDTLRRDTFSEHFDWLPGVSFERAYSTSHWTIPSHASLFTGVYPSESGVHAKSLDMDYPGETLAEAFRRNGYTTRFYTANGNLSFWDGWDRGFDEFVPRAQLSPAHEQLVDWTAFSRESDHSGPSKLAAAVKQCVTADCPTIPALRQGYQYWRRPSSDGGTRDIVDRVAQTDFGNRELVVINLMETHVPYHAPDGGAPVHVDTGDAFADSVANPDHIRSAYGTSASYLATWYRKLYRLLDEDFEYIVTLSDHGEMLGEHGHWNHGYGLYPELVRVPLVLSGPTADRTVTDTTTPVNLLDLHRTIAELAEVSVDSRGRSLCAEVDDRPLLTEYHGFVPWHREMFDRKGVPESTYEMCDAERRGVVTEDGYTYETHADGLQCPSDRTEIEADRTTLQTLVESLDVRSVTADDASIDDEVREQLEQLGYA